MNEALAGWTRETPGAGLVCWQPAKGYRYGVEAYALASFALVALEHLKGDVGGITTLDLGAGSGIVGLLLASRGVQVTAVERDERWAAALRRSIRESGLDIPVIMGDARGLALPAVDLVVSNPPWFDASRGPVSPDDHKAHARSTLYGGPAEFVVAGLRAAPRVCIVVPASTGLPSVPGAWLRRRATVGGLNLGEFSEREGPTEEVTLDPYRVLGQYQGPTSSSPACLL